MTKEDVCCVLLMVVGGLASGWALLQMYHFIGQ